MKPFTPSTFSVLRIGGRSSNPIAKSAEPVYIDEISLSGELLQSFALPTFSSSTGTPFSLSVNDEREGDLDTDFNECTLSVMGYTDIPDGHALKNSSPCPCTKTMSIALIRVEGTIDTRTTWTVTGNSGGGPGYIRPDGAQLRPDGKLYVFAGQAGSCFLDLLKPYQTYNNSIPNEPDRSVLIDQQNGFSARGLQIAGKELDRLQLYAGSGNGVYKVGEGLPDTGPSIKKYTVQTNGGNEGGSFDFQNDTVLYIVDEDPNNSFRSLHRYICEDSLDPKALPCPEGGNWKNDTSFDINCIIDGESQSLWYIAGFYDQDPERPLFFASTHGKDNSLDDVGTNRLVALDTRSGDCRVILNAQRNTVYRGVSLSPNPLNCPNYSPSPSPSPSPSSSSVPVVTVSAVPTTDPSGNNNLSNQGKPDIASILAISFSILISSSLLLVWWYIKGKPSIKTMIHTISKSTFTSTSTTSTTTQTWSSIKTPTDAETQRRLSERSSLLQAVTVK